MSLLNNVIALMTRRDKNSRTYASDKMKAHLLGLGAREFLGVNDELIDSIVVTRAVYPVLNLIAFHCAESVDTSNLH